MSSSKKKTWVLILVILVCHSKSSGCVPPSSSSELVGSGLVVMKYKTGGQVRGTSICMRWGYVQLKEEEEEEPSLPTYLGLQLPGQWRGVHRHPRPPPPPSLGGGGEGDYIGPTPRTSVLLLLLPCGAPYPYTPLLTYIYSSYTYRCAPP